MEPQLIADTRFEEDVRLVGLSALMTPPSQHGGDDKAPPEQKPGYKVMVGVLLDREYARMIGADHYSKDAMGSGTLRAINLIGIQYG